MGEENTSAQKRRGRINKADVLKIVKARNIPKDVVYDVLWAAADLGYEFNRDDLAAHDAELTEKVRRETLKLAENIAFGVSAEFSDESDAAADVGKHSEASNNGRHAHGASVVGHHLRALSAPTPERSNT